MYRLGDDDQGVATTPVYGIPYQDLSDPPDGAALGAGISTAVEAELVRIDGAATTLGSRVTPFEGAWTSYTPTFVSLTGTNPTAASHTRTGRYLRINTHLVLVQVRVVFGAANYGTGVYAMGLPFNATTASVGFSGGGGHALNNALAEYSTTCTLHDVALVRFFHTSASVTNIWPFTFGSSDALWGSILIEPA